MNKTNLFDKIPTKFTTVSNNELSELQGGSKRDYNWGYSIGKAVRTGINNTVNFFKGFF